MPACRLERAGSASRGILKPVTLLNTLFRLPAHLADNLISKYRPTGPVHRSGGHVFRQLAKNLVLFSCFAVTPAYAVDTDAVLGGAVGGGVGAAVGSEVGGREGAIAGSAIGAAIGTAVMTDDRPSRPVSARVEVDNAPAGSGGPPPHAYRTPPGHAKHGKQHKWK